MQRRKIERWFKSINRTLVILLFDILLLNGKAFCSIPPHTRVEEQIRSGIIPLPYHLAKPGEAHLRGINAPNRNVLFKGFQQRKSLSVSTFNALVILVQFPDKAGQTSGQYFDTLLFSNENNSLRRYYSEISYGKMDIITVNLPSVLGWTSVSNNYNFYVNGANGFGAYPNNAQKLVEDAVMSIDSIVDFSKYDNDHDGYVDGLFIVHAGSGAEYTGSVNDIWSHEWATYSPILLDGVFVYNYTMEPEYWQNPSDMTCGVFAHEMGHAVFNLPDLYDYDQDSRGLGRWSLMATGSWNGTLGNSPAHPDAWSLMKMGFVLPQTIQSDSLNFAIHAIEDSTQLLKLVPPSSDGSEYFLIENRQKLGFDSQLRGNGLLIYHVDENQFGNSNQWYPGYSDNGHYKVALVQADGKWDLEKNYNAGDAGDPYPGTSSNHLFNSSSIPNSRNYLGLYTNIGITDIHEVGTEVYANIFVQKCTPIITITPIKFELAMNESDSIAQSIDVFNDGAENLDYSILIDTINSGIPQQYYTSMVHFAFDPVQGTLQPNNKQKLSISIIGNGIPSGSYSTSFRIQSNDSLRPMVDVNLNLTVNKSTPKDQITINIKRGWNMVALPLQFSENVVSKIFPGTNGKAYYFVDLIGYVSTGTINNCSSYWINSKSSQSITLFGTKYDSLVIPVKAGWNMISSFSEAVNIGSIIQDPLDNINSYFFTFDKGYYFTDTLFPGVGYWVSVKEDGYLILTHQKTSFPKSMQEGTIARDNYLLSFQDASNRTKSLYFTDDYSQQRLAGLPPTPPEGSFDVRFQSRISRSYGTLMEYFDANGLERQVYHASINGAEYPVDLTVSGSLRNETELTVNEMVDGQIIQSHKTNYLDHIKITNTNVNIVQIILGRKPKQPEKFVLYQNYPNPFNPTTTIAFDLPTDAMVTIKVFDILGKEIQTLVEHQNYTAGQQKILFNGLNLSSGIYTYRVISELIYKDETQGNIFSDSKTMILLK